MLKVPQVDAKSDSFPQLKRNDQRVVHSCSKDGVVANACD